MTNHKSKRKRRSFWEPESPALVDWLNSQNDLGTSLQLIIVDAIKKYGEGDVIQAYLGKRELDSLQVAKERSSEAPIVQEPTVSPKQVERTEPSQEQSERPTQARATGEQETVPARKVTAKGKRVEHRPEKRVNERPSRPEKPANTPTQPKQQEQQQEPYDSNNAVLDALYKGAEELHAESDTKKSDDDYNPIDIMMGDIGSKMR